MKVDDQLIDKLAALARLEFKPEEKERMKTDLSQMIKFVSKLEELNTEQVAPLIFLTDETNVFRKDEVIERVTKQEALMNVPVRDGDFIKVPKVLRRKD